MKIVSIYTMSQLEALIEYIDMPLLMVKGVSLNYNDLDLDKALEYAKSKNKMVMLSIDKMFTPNELDVAKEYLNNYKDTIDYFYITDLGVCHYAKSLGIVNKVIFDPKTMITNSLDFGIYKNMGFCALGLSSEITISDTLDIINKQEKSAFIQVFGYRLMFYSKRHLVSLYSKKNNEEYPTSDIYFRESTRKDYFPGFENENGTAMYRSYLVSLIDYIDSLNDCFQYFESYHINNDIMIKVLEAFDTKNKDLLNELNLNIGDGFNFKDSVYQKEELKNE